MKKMNVNFNFKNFKQVMSEIDDIICDSDKKDSILTSYILKEFVKFDNPIDMVARLYGEKIKTEKQGKRVLENALEHACYNLKPPTAKMLPSILQFLLGAFPDGITVHSEAEIQWYFKVAELWQKEKHKYDNFFIHFPELIQVKTNLEKCIK